MGIVGIAECLAMVHGQFPLVHVGADPLKVFLCIRNVREILPDDLFDLLPFGNPLFLREGLPFVCAADERIEESFLTDQAVQDDTEVYPEIVPLVSGRIIHDPGSIIPAAVQVFPECLEL